MTLAFQTLMVIANGYFTPSWRKEVRNVAREIILDMHEAKESAAQPRVSKVSPIKLLEEKHKNLPKKR